LKKARLFVATAIALLVMPPAHALEIPTSAQQDNRVRFVNYQPYNITRVVGTIRSSVQVEFAPDEEIAHVALGNTVAWEVAPAGHILFLKPRENQPATNISVVTTRRDGSKRSYQMELVVRDGSVDAGQNTYFYVKYRYPADEAARRRLEEEARKRAAEAGYADQVRGDRAAVRLRQRQGDDVRLQRQSGNAGDLHREL
jgi:type IV secretion system protein VirB9